ncbi:hypothetical protein ACWEKT_22735 [Nocardia takedensis]
MRRIRIIAQLTTYPPEVLRSMPDRPGGKTLEEWKSRFGGSMEGELPDIYGGRRRISLEPLTDLPADTYIDLVFVRSHPGGFGPNDNLPDSVVLSEFDAPPDTSDL